MPKDVQQYIRQLTGKEPHDDNITQAIIEAAKFITENDQGYFSDAIEKLSNRGYSDLEIGIAVGTLKTVIDKEILEFTRNLIMFCMLKNMAQGGRRHVRNQNSENSERY